MTQTLDQPPAVASPEGSAPSAIVIGAGLAGIAATVRLAEAGWRVTLFEAGKQLGGRATSHVDPQTGKRLDNCQHVLLGCCTQTLDLLRRLHLHAVVSAAREWAALPSPTVLDRALAELHRYLPPSRVAQLMRGEVIKERKATFAPAPWIDAVRPVATGPIENLFLCGDYCRTGWPATMESAVRSGYLAAAAASGNPSLAAGLDAGGMRERVALT